MRAFKAFLVLTTVFTACHDNEAPPPDLEQIASDLCEVHQMCNPDDAFVTQEDCETYHRADLAGDETDHPKCFDAHVAWAECVGSLESCDEYEDYIHRKGEKCLEEVGPFYNYCMALSPSGGTQ